MAAQTRITLIDDVDGGLADETVRFSLDGVSYEIDLSTANAKALRDRVGEWTRHARKSETGTKVRKNVPAVGESRNSLIRAWAAKEGIAVPARGRIPRDVRKQFDASQLNRVPTVS